jgi:hypothetical protein
MNAPQSRPPSPLRSHAHAVNLFLVRVSATRWAQALRALIVAAS